MVGSLYVPWTQNGQGITMSAVPQRPAGLESESFDRISNRHGDARHEPSFYTKKCNFEPAVVHDR